MVAILVGSARVSMVGGGGAAPHMDNLPGEILNIILGFLNAVDLYNVSWVCQRLNAAVSDKNLWKVVNFGPHPLNLTYLRKFLRYLGPHTTVVRVTGFVKLGQRPAGPKSTSQCVSEAFLLSLKRRCPNLVELSLRRCFLDALSVKFSLLPKSLRWLCLAGSILLNLPVTRTKLTSPFHHLDRHLPQLEAVDVRHCTSWFTKVDLVVLMSKCPQVRTVRLAERNYLRETKGWSIVSASDLPCCNSAGCST